MDILGKAGYVDSAGDGHGYSRGPHCDISRNRFQSVGTCYYLERKSEYSVEACVANLWHAKIPLSCDARCL